MVDRFLAGTEIVYGVRKRCETDTAFKRLTAEGSYKLIAALGAESVYNHADYRLMSRRAVECLKQYSEARFWCEDGRRIRAMVRVEMQALYTGGRLWAGRVITAQ